MTRDDIAALLARRQEALDRLDVSALAPDYAPDCVLESPFAGGSAVGAEAAEKVNIAFFRAFTDIKFTQDDLLIDGDRAVLFLRASGTNRGGFMGMPPTGRSVNFSIAILYQFRDGLISHERRVYDFTGLLVQVGAIKAKPG